MSTTLIAIPDPRRQLICRPQGAAGLAYSHADPQPGMTYYRDKADKPRFDAAWHAAHCTDPDCTWCQALCDDGFIIGCDGCSAVHHTDWLGWHGHLQTDGSCMVLCPECEESSHNPLLPGLFLSPSSLLVA
ncbi:MAG: hypothetical protein RIQ72_149 [Candidatus Parcubacteria bacterium]